MKNIFALFLMAGVCFGQSQPAIYLTQPYIGNGLSQAQNNFQAQTNIGIQAAGVSNVVLNGVTNKDVRPVALSNNLTVQAQNPNNGDGGAIWLTADTSGGGAANGGEIDITANADDINTIMGKIVISSTNANLASGSLGEIDIFAGDIVNIHGGNTGINLDGITSANGSGITNIPTSGLTGQILLASLTNAGTLWTNGIKFASTNGGLQLTNYVLFQTTNSGKGITNFINAQLAAIQTNLTAANVNTNLNINGRSQEGQDVSKISLLNSSNAVNLVYSRVPATLTWTNLGSGFGIFSNTSGGVIQFNFIDNSGNIWFFKTNSPQGQWSVNFVATNAPTGDWGRVSDFAMGQNAEAFTLTNIPVSAITGVFPIGDLPTNTMTVYAATNASVATNDAFGRPFTNTYVQTSFGWSTNQNLRLATLTNATLSSAYLYPSNTSAISATLTNTVGTSNVFGPAGVFANAYIGDDLASPTAGQYKILSWINASNVICENYSNGASPGFTNNDFVYYPCAAYSFDINKRPSGGIGNGGEVMVSGGFNGASQPGITGGQGGSIFWLNGGKSFWTTLNKNGSRFVWQLHTGALSNACPDAIDVDIGALYESLNILVDRVAVRGLTNTPGQGYAGLPIYGDVMINTTTKATSGLTIQSNVQSVAGQFIGNGGGLTNVSVITTSNAVAAVTVGSSAFLFTNTTPQNLRCFVSGGAATTSVGLNGTTVAASVAGLDYFIVLAPNEYITLTYSVGTPTLNTNRF